MFQLMNNRLAHYALLLATGTVLFLVNLGGPSLWDVDEGRNATAALEMKDSRDWVKPTFNGKLRDHKPVLLYWLQAGAYYLFGVNEFAARFPSALAALFSVLVTYELGRSLFNASTGFLSGLIACTSFMLGAAARFANPDALLNLCLVLTFFLFWHFYSRTGKYSFFLTGLTAGLGMLAKGPVGLVLSLAVIIIFLFWEGKLRIMWTPRLLLGAASFSLVALPWYVLVCVETKGDFLFGFFLRHNVDRFLNPMENHFGGPWYYFVVILAGLAPWSVFIGLTVWYGFWSVVRVPLPRAHSWWKAACDLEQPRLPSPTATDSLDPLCASRYRYLWCWIGVVLLFFTLAATKLPNYVLPVATPMSILTARLLERWRRGLIEVSGWVFSLSLTCFALVGVLVSAGFFLAGGGIPQLRAKIPPVAELQGWVLIGLIPVSGAIGGGLAWRLRRPSMVVASVALASVLFLGPLLIWAAEIFNGYKVSRPLVKQAQALNRTTEIRIVGYKVDHLPSLNFYCQRGVEHCDSSTQALQKLHHAIPVYLFMPEHEWQQLQKDAQENFTVVGRHRDLYRSGNEVLVITNQPKVAKH